MENPRVSIILPTYNRAKFIEKAIESVWTQTYKDIELVIVNDGSTDDTAKIIGELSKENQKIVVVNNDKNSGIVNSLNKGIKVAKGKYIARLDDDDFWLDNKKIEKQVDFLEKNKEYVLVGGGVIKVDKDGKEILRYLLPEKDEDIRKIILIDNVFAHTTVVFKKEVFEKTGGYNQYFLYVEDWDLWMKMGTMGKMYNFQEFFVRYLDQEHNNSNYYRNWGIRQNIKMNIALRQKYKDIYPGYQKAIISCWANYVYSFLPYREKLWPILMKIKGLLLGSSPYKYNRPNKK